MTPTRRQRGGPRRCHSVEFNRGFRLRNDSSGRLSRNRCDGDVHDIRAVLVLHRGTTDHPANNNRDARTIRDRARRV
jgi:hypothetical protein